MKLAKEMLEYEKICLEKGYKFIAGTDEVGRGPLAGPVVVAAVIMPLDEELLIDGIDDSKKLSEKKREKLYPLILERAVAYSIAFSSPEEIDRINILNAVKKCMLDAEKGLSVKPDIILIDAVNLEMECDTMPIIKGDAKSYNIAAASIIAKVYRDNLMKKYAEEFPEYDFASNKGYGTAKHIAALKEKGACSIHRKSFIRNFVK